MIELRTPAGELLTRGVANQSRPDVGLKLHTDGMHGFIIPLPLRQSSKDPIHVFACSTSGRMCLTALDLGEVSRFDDAASIDFRDTMIVVRRERLAQILGNETLVICGPSRGGTSLVAYILLKLGYYLGDNLRDANHEDREILDAVRRPAEMERIIAERNRQSERWGFKVPHAVHFIDWLARSLRNPVFLVAYRNPVAIAKSVVNHDPNFRATGLGTLGSAMEHGLHKMELGIHVVTTSAPSILLDVDAARATPELLVRDLASQFALDASDQRVMTIASSISAGGYKPV